MTYCRLLCYITSLLLLFSFRRLKNPNHFVSISCRNKSGTFQRKISVTLVGKRYLVLAICGLKMELPGAIKTSLEEALKPLTKFYIPLILLMLQWEEIIIFDAIIINAAIYFKWLIRLTQFIRRLIKFNLFQTGAECPLLWKKKGAFTAVVSECNIIMEIIIQSQLKKSCLNYIQLWALSLKQNRVFFASLTFSSLFSHILNHECIYILVLFQAERGIYHSASFY